MGSGGALHAAHSCADEPPERVGLVDRVEVLAEEIARHARQPEEPGLYERPMLEDDGAPQKTGA